MLKKLLLPVSFLLILLACEKKSNDPSPSDPAQEVNQNPSTFLPTKNWVLRAVKQTVNNVNTDYLTTTYPACQRDNIYKFQALNQTSGLGTYLEDDGASVCAGTNPSTNIAAQGSWKVNASNDSIFIRINPSSVFTNYRILKATDKTLEIVYLGNVNQSPATFTYTYKAQ